MTPELFCQIGEALFGPQWRQPLAYALGVNYQSIKRWQSGAVAIPAGVEAELRERLVLHIEACRDALAALREAQEVSDG